MISKEEVLHIAKLARLELSEKEVEQMQHDLSAILDYFAVLKKAPKTEEIGMAAGDAMLRKDEAVEDKNNIADDLISAAPNQKDGYIQVKQVL